MSRSFDKRPNGYSDSIRKGLSAVRGFGYSLCEGTGSREENIARLREELKTADAIVIGAGAGLSTAAGLTYSGERFEKVFFDFIERFGITDMYSGGFYPFPDSETRWAWWARHIYFNRYIDPPKPVYTDLLALAKDKDYFVITTNVDHQFQRAGFDRSRLFYTQGDYGLFQDAQGRVGRTWDNEDWTMLAMEAQGFVRDENGVFQVPEDRGSGALNAPAARPDPDRPENRAGRGDEPARGRYLCGRRGMARSLGELCGLPESARGTACAVPGAGRRRQHPGHNQVPLLGHDSGESQGCLRMPQPQRGRLPESDQRSLHLHRR